MVLRVHAGWDGNVWGVHIVLVCVCVVRVSARWCYGWCAV